MHRFKKTLITLALITTAIWANNTTLFTTPTGGTKLIAHRGVHHVYAGNNRTADTCRAPNVDPITHDFIENTIPSMQAAFEYGADVVELDVHLTSDKTFAVFHDWTLDCQTNGVGITHKHTIADLQKLDVGYNISHNGTDFPLRGTGQTMPTLRDVFNANLNGKFLINFKSDRRSEGTALATLLKTPFNRSQIFGVYGGAAPTQRTIERTPNLRGYHRNGLKSCLIKYMALGWSGYVPAQCRNTMSGIPINYAPLLWGWPHKFTNRMKDAGTDVILWGDYDGTGFSSGIDDLQTLKRAPINFNGYIWTNKIELIGPALKNM